MVTLQDDMCVIPADRDAEVIRELGQLLRERDPSSRITLVDTLVDTGIEERKIEIPASLYESISCLLDAMSLGKLVYIIPIDYLLTTQQAAEILNVSRPYLVKLLDLNEIPYIKVGSHKRVHAQDVISYKNKRDESRFQGLNDLADLHASEGFYD